MWLFTTYKDNSYTGGWMDALQLSSLGFAGVVCKDTNLAVGKLDLDCPSGLVSEVVSFGLSPSDAEIMDACMPNPETDLCDSLLMKENITAHIDSTCLGQKHCTIHVTEFIRFEGALPKECVKNEA
jgi:hypothetical protein